MYKRVLLALDLEGVNNVVGVPYEGLQKGTEQWQVARSQAVLEINAAAEALFNSGVTTVGFWDNHGGGGNVDIQELDRRMIPETPIPKTPRMSFAKDKYDCICFFGYHAMEGTLGGVLAHTMNSKAIQYYKLNGKYIGEVDMDAYIAASMGMPSRFFAAGDVACAQARRAIPDVVTVVTKEELSRNQANFRDNGELLCEIGKSISCAVTTAGAVTPLEFPAIMEKSFKRVEDAASYLKRLLNEGICAEHPEEEVLGRDAHTVVATVNNISEFIKCI